MKNDPSCLLPPASCLRPLTKTVICRLPEFVSTAFFLAAHRPNFSNSLVFLRNSRETASGTVLVKESHDTSRSARQTSFSNEGRWREKH